MAARRWPGIGHCLGSVCVRALRCIVSGVSGTEGGHWVDPRIKEGRCIGLGMKYGHPVVLEAHYLKDCGGVREDTQYEI